MCNGPERRSVAMDDDLLSFLHPVDDRVFCPAADGDRDDRVVRQ